MFFKEVNDIDLGDTQIPNIFIDIFMPMASDLYLKVYLLGYRQACDQSSNPNFDNNSIAKNLNATLDEVLNAWKFWEDKKIVKLHKNEEYDDKKFTVEFLDVKKYYVANASINSESKDSVDSIIETNENPDIRLMFNSINKIVGRYLAPNEKKSLLESMNKYNMNADMIVYAYEYIKEKSGFSKSVKYIDGILRNWYDSNFYTPQDVHESLQEQSERYSMYKEVFRQLGFSRQPTKSEKRIMDEWFDKYEMSMELIISACDKSKNVSNPSISYINGIVKNWQTKNIRTIEDLEKDEEEYRAKEKEKEKNTGDKKNKSMNRSYPNKKTKFHNFNETFTQYSSDELDEIIKKSNRKF